MKNLLITTALGAALAAPVWANDSTIDQIGADNMATVTQSGGTGSTSDVLQTGETDTAWVVQSETTPGGSDTNRATVRQLRGSGSQSASVNQNYEGGGASNVATIVQESTDGGNSGSINQNGDANDATVVQGPGSATACLPPLGCAAVTPEDITNSSASILQDGSGNIATSSQIVGSNGGDNNHATTTQKGDLNTAAITQGTGALASVWGLANLASNDNDNLAFIDQTGIGNESAIEQGGESGLASNGQTGDDNASVIVQSGGLPGLGNKADVFQTGNGNDSSVTQTSLLGDIIISPFGNNANVTQIGNDNGSTVIQNDLGGHKVTVLQTGTQQSSLIEQNGFQNAADVTQSLTGQVSVVTQTGPLSAPAIQNTATVSQTQTASNLSQVTQSGMLNVTSVMQ